MQRNNQARTFDQKPKGKFTGPRKKRSEFQNNNSENRNFQKRRRFSSSKRKNRFQESKIDISKFINKAVITEEAEKFVPEHAFDDFKILTALKKNIADKKYKDPTPIQDRAIPLILKQQDVVGIANTGTGKTAAFLIPLINKVLTNPKEKILIITPTRELAIQIEQEFKEFRKNLRMFSVCCVGGANIGPQIRDLKRFHNFIIGTPGRIKDLIDRKFIFLENFKTIVLDEADRMLDMGFIDDVRYMISLMPKEKQTLFFSATMSKEIEKLITEFLKNPTTISVKTHETPDKIDQDVIKVEKGLEKVNVLGKLLKDTDFDKILIFGKTKRGVEKLTDTLIKKGFKAESIHGDKTHFKRQKALELFKENRVNILVATDVAARGLDIKGVSHVINYDLPATYEDYVHRIGRTGRAGKTGKAITFID